MADRLADELAAAEAEIDRVLLDADVDQGLVPPGARRALLPQEIDAKTNFAGMQAEVDEAAAMVAHRLAQDRAAFLELLAADLAATAARSGPLSPILAVALRVLDVDGVLGLQAVSGARPLLEAAETAHRASLQYAAEGGMTRLRGEAAAQGLDLPSTGIKLAADAADHLDIEARRLAQGPLVDLMAALRAQVAALPTGGIPEAAYRQALLDAGAALAVSPLETLARGSVQQAHGLGRQAAALHLAEPKSVYASELLDRNTCGPCSLIDGHEYASLEEGLGDYPNGTYWQCEGGDRCRGTLVFVWSAESDPEA